MNKSKEIKEEREPVFNELILVRANGSSSWEKRYFCSLLPDNKVCCFWYGKEYPKEKTCNIWNEWRVLK